MAVDSPSEKSLDQNKNSARELTLQVLFQMEFALPIPIADFIHLYDHKISSENQEYAEMLIQGVNTDKIKLDQLIQSHSHHWKIERMALVEKNILRMSIFEMKFAAQLMKPSIVINEAVNLAKKYGSSESGSFVNGILDQINKNT